MSEALKALREARETLDRLLEQYPSGFTARRFELNKDLKHIQDQITILENFLDPDSTYNPYAPKRPPNVKN